MWSKTPNFILPLRPGWYFKSEKRAPPEAEPKGWVVQNPVQPETGPAVLDPIPSKGMLITLDSASVHSRPNPAFPVTVPFGAWAKSAEPRTIRMPSPLPGRVARLFWIVVDAICTVDRVVRMRPATAFPLMTASRMDIEEPRKPEMPPCDAGLPLPDTMFPPTISALAEVKLIPLPVGLPVPLPVI